MKWQPIETAPKDGTPFLAVCETGCGARNHWIVRWEWVPHLGQGSFVCGSDAEGLTDLGAKGISTAVSCLAHWRPLPDEPPA